MATHASVAWGSVLIWTSLTSPHHRQLKFASGIWARAPGRRLQRRNRRRRRKSKHLRWHHHKRQITQSNGHQERGKIFRFLTDPIRVKTKAILSKTIIADNFQSFIDV